MSEMVGLFWHEHPVYERDGRVYEHCHGCYGMVSSLTPPSRLYHCLTCKGIWHTSCAPSSAENINHPCHPAHPLELLVQGPPNYSDKKCSLCQGDLSTFIYHCKLCDFSVDMKCVMKPPPLMVDHPKCHEHALTLMGRDVSFTCNACGEHGERNPYVCLPCSLMFHRGCIDLPHVININRHDHRVYHTNPLKPGNQICEICRKDINWRYGAYSCNKCPNYFVHSTCATHEDVWDGLELEGVPEEEIDTAPFKVIEEGVINHFSHEEHNLFLVEDVIIVGGEDIICEACCHPLSFERYYKCMECDYMLHEECANLPLQKRHGLSTDILFLLTGKEKDEIGFRCTACARAGTGFRYEDGDDIVLDVHCASLSWFRHRKLHPHTIFLTTILNGDCACCDETESCVLSCVDCEFFLCFRCTTLPVVIKHRCDDHYLFLSSGEKATTGKHWCEICEAEINPEKWLYTCYDCGVVCHIDCVVGDSLNIKPGFLRKDEEVTIEVVLNDHNTRPLCSGCGTRCRFPKVYNVINETLEGLYCWFGCIGQRVLESSEASSQNNAKNTETAKKHVFLCRV